MYDLPLLQQPMTFYLREQAVFVCYSQVQKHQ